MSVIFGSAWIILGVVMVGVIICIILEIRTRKIKGIYPLLYLFGSLLNLILAANSGSLRFNVLYLIGAFIWLMTGTMLGIFWARQ